MSFNVLIVEDEEPIRKLIVRALNKSGLQLSDVYEAEDGAQGLRMLTENKNIDFALIDLHMPVMNGDEIVARIQKTPDLLRMPVIFISGETRPYWIETLERKSLGFIRKPFTIDTLGETIMNLLSK